MISAAEFYKWLQIFGVRSGSTPSGALLILNNLSDVNNVATSRANLSVPATSSFAGNPNGHVAGAKGDFCIDTTDSNVLYYCVTAGTTTTAVWIQNGALSGFLLASNNLSDVASIATARANLSVPAISSYPGNPNGHVAGAVNDLVRDQSNETIWICLTAGTTTTAVWVEAAGQGDLLAANNLSDVNSIDTARVNLSAPKINTFAGNPNGHVAGIIGDLCVNTDSDVTFTCTFAGTTSSAVWTAPAAEVTFPAVIINANITLDASAFGKTIVCRGGSYTVTLPPTTDQPSPTSGVDPNIYFVFENNPQNFVNIVPQSGDYVVGPGYAGGSYTYQFGYGETLKITSSGDVGILTWYPSVSLQPVYLSAGLSTSLTSATSLTTVKFDQVVDINCQYNSSTGIIAPIFPGRYELSVTLTSRGTTVDYTQSAGFNISGGNTVFAQNNNAANDPAQSVTFTTIQPMSGTGSPTTGGAGTATAVFASTATVPFGGTISVNQLAVRRICNY